MSNRRQGEPLSIRDLLIVVCVILLVAGPLIYGAYH